MLVRLARWCFALPVAIALSGCDSRKNGAPPVDGSAGAETGSTDGPAAERIGGSASDAAPGDQDVSVRDTASTDQAGPTSTGDGAIALPGNATEVCVAAIKAATDRAERCLGVTVDYGRYTIGCPDSYFNPDSNRTVAEVAACLGYLTTQPCTDLWLDFAPTCLASGKRPAGAGCLFPSQCQGKCRTVGICAKCEASVPLGGKCNRGDCEPGTFCHLATSICTDAGTIVHAAEGQPCDLTATPVVGCIGDLHCRTSTSWAGVCAPMEAGVACGTILCGPGTYCSDSATERCTSFAVVGQPCSPYLPDLLPLCVTAMCVNGKCMPRRAVGEACDADNPCGEYLACVAGACQLLVCPA